VPSLTPDIPDEVGLQVAIEDPLQHVSSAICSCVRLPDVGTGPGVSSLKFGGVTSAITSGCHVGVFG
jgi:hypothetical protein